MSLHLRITKNINLQVRGRLADMFTIQKEKERLLFEELTRQPIKENRPSEILAKWAFADFKPRGPASFIPNLRKRVSIIPCNHPRHENYSTAFQSSFYVKRERLFTKSIATDRPVQRLLHFCSMGKTSTNEFSGFSRRRKSEKL